MTHQCMFNRNGSIICYTDGACPNNGQPGATAGIGVFFGVNHVWNISERLSSDRRQTNNTAEILAATLAIQKVWLNGEYTLEIRSDSEVLVKGITDWIHQWERNGWKTALGAPVINKREYCELRDAMSQMNKVDFVHVRREHNKQADALARDGANFRV